MNVIAVTQKGLNKTENEDRIIVGKTIVADGTLFSEIDNGIIAVADGVGGYNAGAIASHFVANKLCHLREISVELLRAINDELISISESTEGQEGMATTLSGICCVEGKPQLFSIGNTRVYLLQSRKYLKQLTTDDTTLNYLLATGQIAPEDSDSFERKNEITACFGGGSADLFKVRVNYIEPIVAPVMITSDGIHDYLSVDQMEDIIGEHGLSEKTCFEMIQTARNNGSLDDASIIIGGV
jgi:serine/threonine protein phosphatase PrpC